MYQTPRKRLALDIQSERNATIKFRRLTNIICSWVHTVGWNCPAFLGVMSRVSYDLYWLRMELNYFLKFVSKICWLVQDPVKTPDFLRNFSQKRRGSAAGYNEGDYIYIVCGGHFFGNIWRCVCYYLYPVHSDSFFHMGDYITWAGAFQSFFVDFSSF